MTTDHAPPAPWHPGPYRLLRFDLLEFPGTNRFCLLSLCVARGSFLLEALEAERSDEGLPRPARHPADDAAEAFARYDALLAARLEAGLRESPLRPTSWLRLLTHLTDRGARPEHLDHRLAGIPPHAPTGSLDEAARLDPRRWRFEGPLDPGPRRLLLVDERGGPSPLILHRRLGHADMPPAPLFRRLQDLARRLADDGLAPAVLEIHGHGTSFGPLVLLDVLRLGGRDTAALAGEERLLLRDEVARRLGRIGEPAPLPGPLPRALAVELGGTRRLEIAAWAEASGVAPCAAAHPRRRRSFGVRDRPSAGAGTVPIAGDDPPRHTPPLDARDDPAKRSP